MTKPVVVIFLGSLKVILRIIFMYLLYYIYVFIVLYLCIYCYNYVFIVCLYIHCMFMYPLGYPD
jgi:hypothetical protein